MPEILILITVLIHIQNETLEGVFDKAPYEFESFEDGLKRYRLNLNKNDIGHYDELKKMFNEEDLIRSEIEFEEYPLRKRSNSLDSREFDFYERYRIGLNFKLKSNYAHILRSNPDDEII